MIHVIYTINYLIFPKPSMELIIGVLYLFLRRCALSLQVTENSTETGLKTNRNSLARISAKYSYGRGFGQAMVLIRVTHTQSHSLHRMTLLWLCFHVFSLMGMRQPPDLL